MSDRDAWETPQLLFNELNEEFHFTIDLCASDHNAKCDKHFTDYLSSSPISSDVCFMNPPYSNPKPFIAKAWEDSRVCTIVCLVKVDTSTQWWAVFWDYEHHKPKPGATVRFLPKRVKYVPPTGWVGGSSGPSFPSAILIFNRTQEKL